VCDAWRVDLNLARHGSALPRVSYYIPLHTAPRLRCQLSKQNRMDFPSLSPRARVNLWIVNFSLTAYAGVLLGLLACLIRDQIKSSNQIKCGKSFEDAMSHAYLFLRRILRTLRESVKSRCPMSAICPRLSWLSAHAFARARVNPWLGLPNPCIYFPSIYAGNPGK
jgi:hypothetical protein